MPATAIVTPAKLVPALHAFIAQRSGIDPRMYGGCRKAFMGDYRQMIQAGKDARVMLAYVSRSSTITPAMWANALSTTYRFDWNDDTAQLKYTTGQFFGVEYRAAVCRLLASLFFQWSRYEAGGRVYYDNLWTFARREFGRGLASRWFRFARASIGYSVPLRAGVHGARMTYPVRAVYTSSDAMHPATLTAQRVASKTAAVRLCRALGHRVLTVGGIVELSTDSIDTDGTERMAWTVTVHFPAER